jgi:hypothetical protein
MIRVPLMRRLLAKQREFTTYFALSLAIGSCFWVAERLAYSGYWDDSILFVGLSERVPQDPIGFTNFVLNQDGDLFGPYINGILATLQAAGLTANWSLVLISNLCLVALCVLLYFGLRQFDFERTPSLVAVAALFVSPVLSDQRTWFIPIQHTITICLSLSSLLYTRKLVKNWADSSGPSYSQTLTINLLLLALALGRETSVILAVVVIASLLVYRPRFFHVLVMSWAIPLFAHLFRFATSKTGSHVDWALEQTRLGDSLIAEVRSALQSLNTFSFSVVILLVFMTITAGQIIFHRFSKPSSKPSGMRVALVSDWSRLQTLRVSLLGLLVLYIDSPRLGTPLGAVIPPFSRWPTYWLYDDRWSQLWFDNAMYVIAIVLIFAGIILSTKPVIGVVTLVTFACTAPFLITGQATFDATENRPASAVSRYAIYFFPIAALLLASIIQNLFEKVARNARVSSAAMLVCLAVLLVPDAARSISTVVERTSVYRSIDLKECGNRTFAVVTAAGERFTSGYVTKYLDESANVLVNDFRLKHTFPKLDNRVLGLRDYLDTCLEQLPLEDAMTYVVTLIDEGELESEFELLQSLLTTQPESVSRTQLRRIFDSIPE